MQNLIDTIKKFKGKKILVIGDLMLDEYVWGKVERISAEAPVQVVDVQKETHVPGGAANLANNISSLSASAYLSGVVGSDNSKKILIKNLKKKNIKTSCIVTEKDRPTIKKMRIMGHNQQLLRIDYEKTDIILNSTKKKIMLKIKEIIKSVDAVVISDYEKGINHPKMIKEIISLSNKKGKPIVVDSKSEDYKNYRGATIFTPNHKEASRMVKMPEKTDEDIIRVGGKLVKDLKSNILITRGEKGMSLFEKNKKTTHIPTKAKEVFDVTGAGDTVTAAVALSLASGASLEEAALIATHAASVVIAKIGTSTVSPKEMIQDIKNG